MGSFFNHSLTKTNHGLLSSLSKISTVSLLALLPLITLPACDRTTHATNNTPEVEILGDKVVVDSALILTSSPERYQPSYNLKGALVAIEKKRISSPYNAYNPQPLVKVGDWVAKNQPLLRLQSNIDSSELKTAHYEFIEVIQSSASNTAGVKSLGDTPSVPSLTANQAKIAEQSDDQSSTSPAQTTKKATNQTAVVPQSALSSHDSKTNSPILAESVAPKPPKTDVISDTTKNTALNESNKLESVEPIVAGVENAIAPATIMPIKTQTTLVLKSPIEGEVTTLADFNNATDTALPDNGFKTLLAYTPLVTVADTRSLQLVGELPLNTESQLSVGQAVKFTVYDAAAEFTGQISHVLPQPKKGYLTVRAPVLASQENKVLLEPGMQALMTIEYGQIELGVRVPRQAIHEALLTDLDENYTRPVSPIHGFIWIIGQNKRLAYTPIEIVAYFPESDQFLVHGINNDSLICLADLPRSVDGFKVSVN